MAYITQSCAEQEIDSLPSPTTNISSTQPTEIKLVRKINNPYSLTNMRKAFKALNHDEMLKSGILKADTLVATHYYVRFLPKDSAEYEALKADTTLTLFPYPLDYELTAGTTFYDSTLTADQITWQYTKVPIDYSFTNVEYQKLDELYIPIDLPGYVEPTELKSAGKSYYDLLAESLVLTGNATKDSSDLKGWFPKSWHPSATIKVWDDIMGQCIPLVGVKVRARHLVHWSTASTDGNGYTSLGKFYVKVNYSVIYEAGQFDIRDGLLVQGIFNGPEQKAHWDLNITSGQSLQMATMFRAAHRFYYQNIVGINRPPQSLKLCYINKSGDVNGKFTFEGNPLGDIWIYGYNSESGVYRPTYDIFYTSTHELAHAAHYHDISWDEYIQVSEIIKESWAVAVGYYITKQEYLERGVTISNNSDFKDWEETANKQSYWNPNIKKPEYSPLFIDLIDNSNQDIKYSGEQPFDEVIGYTIPQLNKILLKSYDTKSLKANLENEKPIGVTDTQLDKLFELYEK